MILSRYIARRFFWTFLQVLGVFWAIMVMIDMADQLRRFSDQGISLSKALWLSLMNTPSTLYTILPLIMVLSAIALFLALARSSELVVIRAAGRSGLRFLVAPLMVGLAIGAFSVAVLNPLVAATSKEYDRLWVLMAKGGASTLSISESGLWLRQGTEEGQSVIHALRANADATTIYGATFLFFGQDATPTIRIEANTAELVPGAWRLTGAKKWVLDDPNPERSATAVPDGAEIASNLTREGIQDSFGDPSSIAFWALPDYIKGLEDAGFSARAHRLWYQMELAQPLLLAAMILLAAGFTMRHTRFGGTGMMVLLAILGGFSIFFLRNFAQVLGQNGQVPIELAAWAAPTAAILLALTLLLHVEDG